MRVRLTRKFADRIDGVDISNCHVGDVLDLASPEARLLVAEEWAIPERRGADVPVSLERRRVEDVPTRIAEPNPRSGRHHE
jgi:hypothetical protein